MPQTCRRIHIAIQFESFPQTTVFSTSCPHYDLKVPGEMPSLSLCGAVLLQPITLQSSAFVIDCAGSCHPQSELPAACRKRSWKEGRTPTLWLAFFASYRCCSVSRASLENDQELMPIQRKVARQTHNGEHAHFGFDWYTSRKKSQIPQAMKNIGTNPLFSTLLISLLTSMQRRSRDLP